MTGLKRFFGGRSGAEKRAQREAEIESRRQQRASEEELARTRAAREASGRLLRTGGRRSLAWQGSETGVATTYGG